MIKLRGVLNLATVSALALIASANLAYAQTAPAAPDPQENQASQIDDIVVTAQKREQAVNEIPLSITAL